MRHLLLLGVLSLTLGCTPEPKENDMTPNGPDGHHHGHDRGGQEHRHAAPAEAEIVVKTDPAHPVEGHPVTLQLMIHDADGKMVKDYDVAHEEKVHLAVVREGLDHFAHLHPAVDAKGNLSIEHVFPAGGKYLLCADYTPLGGGHATATGSLEVRGHSPAARALTPDVPGEVRADGVRATVSTAPPIAGSPAGVAFTLRDEAGSPVELEPYMGALGHLMFVSVAGRFVHVHPKAGEAAAGTVEFEAHFPEPGVYKGWGQFNADGRVRVVPFVTSVD